MLGDDVRKLAARLPEWAKQPLRRLRNRVQAMPYLGRGRWCPVCGKASRRFRPFGVVPRDDAQCIHCGSVERDRLTWLFLQARTDLFDGRAKRMLHVAPEACFEARLKSLPGLDYLTADLSSPHVMVRMDVTAIPHGDESFDVIYCSHVLEHVPDDRRAMRELCRVLKRHGWAILLVPVLAEKTFEDPAIVDPAERLWHFGQEDHVRVYGPDYLDRLREAGFVVQLARVGDLADGEQAVRMGLSAASGEIYYCTKR
jgi:SAM-dependent methyltransferase